MKYLPRAAGLRRLTQDACCVGVVYCGGRLLEMCVIFGESSVRACVNVVYSGEMLCVCSVSSEDGDMTLRRLV